MGILLAILPNAPPYALILGPRSDLLLPRLRLELQRSLEPRFTAFHRGFARRAYLLPLKAHEIQIIRRQAVPYQERVGAISDPRVYRVLFGS